MELSTKLYILDDNGQKFMGAGVLWLLEGVEETGSLLSAARGMGLSYTKARFMLESLEKGLGQKILDRKKGGAEHSGGTLTPFAKEFISLYREFQSEVKADAERRFRGFSASVEKLMEEGK
ncbi:MAG: LysR family transcriptional regulator [Spirochaetes bacterium]|uniref:LysR family transcriptional regulator n=1 Tax=Candidatus Ornithospirochaeta stercoripullorum TaxID=2840899 RepID=A0A9D9H5Q3_9SPIO|nr:LysR family transcriptional regulator [Candidatus Ornithospirochaeta stercoripullorum]